MIFACDVLLRRFNGTIYEAELQNLRQKYIYKDIPDEEYLKDRDWIIELKKIK